MKKTLVRIKWLPLSVSAFLFVLLFPVLDLFTHPFSVMYGHYVPLVERLSGFYWHTPFLDASLIGVPLLLFALLLIMQWRQFGLGRSSLLVLGPFSLTLFLQYFIAIGLDKYLMDFSSAGLPIPWDDVFQFSLILNCLLLFLIYASLAASLWFCIFVVQRVAAYALTSRRCS